ncbi:U-scoloptoxin(01)-Cw1a-like [Macrobrachium rosenbergii]|uniref:U-scoloptoxin(01)-Cw1a-like n=1 Tax=Macrobrachium rosenbergii TaxID=79674 RepID=UPI0034D4CCD8
MKAVFVLALVAIAAARMAYELPDGAETLLPGSLQTTFSCDSRPYGYYADVDNGCQVFHVCVPIVNEEGDTTLTAHFSFVCGNQTIFNQETLTCAHPDASLPCSEAPSLYESSNADFGKIPEDD